MTKKTPEARAKDLVKEIHEQEEQLGLMAADANKTGAGDQVALARVAQDLAKKKELLASLEGEEASTERDKGGVPE